MVYLGMRFMVFSRRIESMRPIHHLSYCSSCTEFVCLFVYLFVCIIEFILYHLIWNRELRVHMRTMYQALQ